MTERGCHVHRKNTKADRNPIACAIATLTQRREAKQRERDASVRLLLTKALGLLQEDGKAQERHDEA